METVRCQYCGSVVRVNVDTLNCPGCGEPLAGSWQVVRPHTKVLRPCVVSGKELKSPHWASSVGIEPPTRRMAHSADPVVTHA